ncbi:hypothetical protein GCM10023198_48500 [Promicromonospora umidemergens]|uniref:Uncharacterized protein n=1 Tax=Promicromonospora umidemergens TaxID=629679 RepID=A0ABP8Y043_9MICO
MFGTQYPLALGKALGKHWETHWRPRPIVGTLDRSRRRRSMVGSVVVSQCSAAGCPEAVTDPW